MQASLIPLLMFTLSMTLTPGPNNLMVMTSSLNFGWQRSLPHYLGICLGFPLMVAVMSAGLAQLIMDSPRVFMAIKLIAASYLFYLAWKIATTVPTDLKVEKQGKPFSFLQAAAFQWVNPKAWAMALSAFTLFAQGEAALIADWIRIPGVFLLVAFPCVGTWLLLGQGLSKLIQNPRALRLFNWVMAILLVASVLPGLLAS